MTGRCATATFALLAACAPLGAATVGVDGSAGGRQQPIDGFGTCIGGSDGSSAAFQQLYYDDMGCSILRVDLTPSYISPYSDNQYNSPTWAQPGPNGNYCHAYTNASTYTASWNGHTAPIAVMGPDITQNIAKLNWNDVNVLGRGAMAQAGKNRAAALGGFKLYGSVWSPPPWLKLSSGHSIGTTFANGPAAGTPWPFIWLGNFAGGKLDTSGTALSIFNDGVGPTSALTQWARTIAAEIKGYQDKFGVPFYAVSLQNELNFEEFYNSCTYQTSPEYLAMVKAVKAEFAKYPDLAGVKIAGPEDLMGGDAWAMWQYGSGSTATHKNLQYLQSIAADPTAAAAVDMFCIHGYAPDGASSAGASPTSWSWWANGWTTAPALGLPAPVSGFTAYGKKSWMTETSGEDPLWLSPSTGFPSNGAFSIAVKIHQALTAGRESGWLYWQMGNDTSTTTQTLTDSVTRQNAVKYVAAKHFYKYIRPGSVRLNATSSASDLLASAYVNDASGALTVVLVNSNASAQSATITLSSTPAVASFSAYTSSNGGLWLSSTVGVSGGQASVSVPGYGVVTLTGTASAPPPAPNVAPTVSLTSPANGSSYTAPASISLAANAADSDGSVTKVEFYAGTTLLGTDTTSPYSLTWSNVAAGTYSITAKAYDNSGAVTTSGAISVTVNAPPPAPNVAPTVSLTSPTNGSSYTAPASISLAANAADSDGSVTKVEFYAGTTLLGTDTTSPYSLTWSNVAAGTYSITAKAYDNSGAITTSAAVSVTVNAAPPAPNVAPTVSLTSPTNGSSYTAPASISLAANAADSDGSVTKVEFYAGTTLLGTDTTSPYSLTWSNVAAGTYSITAKAYDNAGAITTSGAVSVTVAAAPTPPPSSSGNGLTAQYWSNQLATFNGSPTLVRTDATIAFDWGSGSPASTITTDHFTARWTGQVLAPTSETYTFWVTGDDGVRLWVNGQLLIDKWIDQSPTEWSGAIALSAGQKYDLKLEYYENGGGAVAKLAWSTPTIAKAIVPQAQLFPASGTGLSATYWDNIDFTGATVSRVDPSVDFDWGSGSPAAAIGPDTFSARWSGYVCPPATGTYTFTTTSDDGVRLWVNGQLLIDNWTNHAPTANSGSIALTGGGLYAIRMDYFENTGGAVARLHWSSAAMADAAVPSSALYPAVAVATAQELAETGTGGGSRCGLGGGIAALVGLALLGRRPRSAHRRS